MTGIAFIIFAIVIALTGGSSRPDIVWLIVLRPVVVLCIITMLLAGRPTWRSIAPLPMLLGLFALTIAIQLVPLPPILWQGLGGRSSYDAVERVLGGADRWHPLAIAPDRAWNSLVALLVPFGVIIGYALLNTRQRLMLLLPLLSIVAFSMILGVAQIASGGTSPLYWYKVSGHGQMIGLLANRNHQGALLAMTLPLLRAWMSLPSIDAKSARARGIFALFYGAIIVLYVLVLGSRAGLALTGLGIVAAFLVRPTLGPKLSRRRRWLIAAGLAMGIILILGLALNTDRAVTLGRISSDDLSTEGRLAALPTLLHIIHDTFPWGTGFGSFVGVYTTYEPDLLLKPTYFNNAHNDLIELAITGGAPALAVFLCFIAWWAKSSWRSIFSTEDVSWATIKRSAFFSTLILLIASLVDYPLRTPLLGAVFTLLCCWLAQPPALGISQDDG
ncbi:O-antigen ligase family protein [Sphingomonas melonis]|uniref:O-antigen ligase family protein n=1 Tax=Sphingomonas melonis TaxID=152682 RepID=UPI001C8CC412|nr:O-antigen ligase family protein [Sphingomonas melonis]MBX8846628.1 O-antigen ligase family protein [Sphingomonas melonis]MBX8855783.1 O-antigen ligase family protein [Sphingomonas melonis]MBX8900864.1 O-antigen ligase family protein [Sphingomonas melonis]